MTQQAKSDDELTVEMLDDFYERTNRGMHLTLTEQRLAVRTARKGMEADRIMEGRAWVPRACLNTCADLMESKWPTMADTLRGFASENSAKPLAAPTAEQQQGRDWQAREEKRIPDDWCRYVPPTEVAPMGECKCTYGTLGRYLKRGCPVHDRSADAGEIVDKLLCWTKQTELPMLAIECREAASLIERQAAELRKIRLDWADDSNEAVIEIDRLKAEIERLSNELVNAALRFGNLGEKAYAESCRSALSTAGSGK